MKIAQLLRHRASISALLAAGELIGTSVSVTSQEMVARPGAEPECFAPWAADTTYIQYPAQEGPYRIALANGYIANTLRIQMIQTAKAFAAQPDVTAKLAEFKVVSTGEDVATQISAINNFIDSGYQAIIVIAQNPMASGPVIKRAKDAGHAMVPFAGETENGFRKFCAAESGNGLVCTSSGTGPAQVAVAIKTAIAFLEGNVLPQAVKLPTSVVEDPGLKDGENFYSDQSDNFFVGNAFPDCKVNIDASEIMGQTEADQ